MNRFSAVDAIKPALQRTHEVLARPIVSVRFAVICFLATFTLPAVDLPAFLTRRLGADETQYAHQFSAFTFSPMVKFLFIGIAVVVGIAFVVLVVLTIFRLPFMLFDLVTGRRTTFRELWNENGSLALQFFGFLFCVGAAVSIFTAAMHYVVPHLLPEQVRIGHFFVALEAGVSLIANLLLYWIISDFFVPLLALEGGTALDGIKKTVSLMAEAPLEFLAYFAVKLVLATISSVIFAAIFALSIFVSLLPAEGFGIRLLQANTTNGVTSLSAAIILTGIVSLLLLLLFMLVRSFLTGPVAVFFQAYAIFFFAGRYPVLHDLLNSPTESLISPSLPTPRSDDDGSSPLSGDPIIA